MCLPYRGDGDDGDDPGHQDADLGIGDGPVGEGGHRGHHSQEPEVSVNDSRTVWQLFQNFQVVTFVICLTAFKLRLLQQIAKLIRLQKIREAFQTKKQKTSQVPKFRQKMFKAPQKH